MFKIGFVKPNYNLMINLAARLTGVNPHAVAIAVHRLSHITQIIIMAQILVMAEEIDDQEILLVATNKTVLFQRVVNALIMD